MGVGNKPLLIFCGTVDEECCISHKPDANSGDVQSQTDSDDSAVACLMMAMTLMKTLSLFFIKCEVDTSNISTLKIIFYKSIGTSRIVIMTLLHEVVIRIK